MSRGRKREEAPRGHSSGSPRILARRGCTVEGSLQGRQTGHVCCALRCTAAPPPPLIREVWGDTPQTPRAWAAPLRTLRGAEPASVQGLGVEASPALPRAPLPFDEAQDAARAERGCGRRGVGGLRWGVADGAKAASLRWARASRAGGDRGRDVDGVTTLQDESRSFADGAMAPPALPALETLARAGGRAGLKVCSYEACSYGVSL
jgi:hypothetical protein